MVLPEGDMVLGELSFEYWSQGDGKVCDSKTWSDLYSFGAIDRPWRVDNKGACNRAASIHSRCSDLGFPNVVSSPSSRVLKAMSF